MAAASLEYPWVILHQATSLDGNLTGFELHGGIYYGCAEQLEENATLCAALALCRPDDEIEPEIEDDKAPVAATEDDKRPICVITDSKGRVRNWHVLKKTGIWRDFVALVSAATPAEYLEYLKERNVHYIKTGEAHADLKEALKVLRRDYGVRRIRVDGCAALNGALWAQGLVDELSLLMAPAFTATGTPLINPSAIMNTSTPLKLINALEAGAEGYVWLRYLVVKI